MFFSSFLPNSSLLRTQRACDPSGLGSSALGVRAPEAGFKFKSSAGSQVIFLLNSNLLFFHFPLY